MPAAKPSKAAISNAIAAAMASGFTPTSIKVGPDGALTIDITTTDTNGEAEKKAEKKGPRNSVRQEYET